MSASHYNKESMPEISANIVLAATPSYYFSNASIGDLLIYGMNGTDQKILMGTKSNGDSLITLGQTSVVMNAPITIGDATGNVRVSALNSNLVVDGSVLPGMPGLSLGSADAPFETARIDGRIITSNLDAYGKSSFSNDVYVSSGDLTVTNAAHVLGAFDVGGASVLSGTTTVGGTFTSKDHAVFSSNLTVLGSLNVTTVSYAYSNVTVFSSETINSNLTVMGETDVDGKTTLRDTLTVTGVTTLSDAALLSSTLSVMGSATLSNGATVYGATRMEGDTTVMGVASLSNAAFLSSNLTVVGITTLSNDTTVYGAATVNGASLFNGTATTLGVLTASNLAVFDSNVRVRDELAVDGEATLNSSLTLYGALVASNVATFASDVTVAGTTTLYGQTTLSNASAHSLTVTSGPTTLGVTSLGDTTVNGTLNMTGGLTLNGATNMSNNLSVSSNLTVGGTATIDGATLVNSSVRVTSNLNVEGSATVNSNVSVLGQLTVQNATALVSTLDVSSNVTLMQAVAVGGSLTVASNVNVAQVLTTSNAVMTGPVTMSDTMALTGTMAVYGASTLSNALTVVGLTDLRSNLSVGGTTTLSDSLTVVGSTLALGPVSLSNDMSTSCNVAIEGSARVYQQLRADRAVVDSNLSAGTLTVLGGSVLSNGVTVDGTALITGSVSMSNDVRVKGDVFAGCNLDVANLTTTLALNATYASNQMLSVSSNATVMGVFTASNNAFFASNLTVLGDLDVRKLTFLYSNVTIFDNEEVRSNLSVDGMLSASNDVNFSAPLTLRGSNSTLTFANEVGSSRLVGFSNRLGVNTGADSNPMFTLDINGDINFTGEIYKNGAIFSGWNSNAYGNYINSNAAFRGPATEEDAVLIYSTSNENKSFAMSNDGGKAVLYSLSNCFGIGAQPAAGSLVPTFTQVLLQVAGDAVVSANAYVASNLLVDAFVGVGIHAPAYPVDVQSTMSNVSINCVGKLIASEFSIFSDRRIKTNVQTVDAAACSAIIEGLRVCEYEYIDTRDKGVGRKTGFIAQEVEAVAPECVSTGSEFVPNVNAALQVLSWTDDGAIALAATDEAATAALSTPGLEVRCRGMSGRKIMAKVAEGGATEGGQLRLQADTHVPEDDRSHLFVVGTRVDDFKMLNQERINAIAVAALQAYKDRLVVLEKTVAGLVAARA